MKTPTANSLLKLESDVIEAGMAAQSTALDLLLAEMQALAVLIPGQADPLRTDAEVEADFDNMPV